MFNCWHCGTKGDILKLIIQIENCSFQRAKEIENEFQGYQIKELKRETQKKYNQGEDLLEKFIPIKPWDYCFNYLRGRNFSPQSLIVNYDLRRPKIFNWGDWKFRIIIPIYMDGRVVNFTSRDVTEKSLDPKKHCPNKNAIVPVGECLYNIDSVKKRVLIVEGPADVWRMGPGTVCSFGKLFTPHRMKLLKKKNLEMAAVMFDSAEKDPEAPKAANDLASQLSIFIPQVKVIELEHGDPADLNENEANNIGRRVFE